MHDLAQRLVESGYEPNIHHATLRAAVRKHGGGEMNAQALRDLRKEMKRVSGVSIPDKEEEYLLRMLKEDPEKWEKVVSVERWTDDGSKALLVTIECEDPQEDRWGESVCERTRTVMVQELWQVYRCQRCQDRANQIYLNRRARERRRERASGDSS